MNSAFIRPYHPDQKKRWANQKLDNLRHTNHKDKLRERYLLASCVQQL
jgi:hypothetical protein